MAGLSYDPVTKSYSTISEVAPKQVITRVIDNSNFGNNSSVQSTIDTSAITGAIQQIQDILKYNNAKAIQAATDQRNWTERMWEQNSEFNASEAAKNRDWQEYMSNTAHQREIADLKAAGLNPVLSAMGGNGATVTSGSTASASYGNGSQADLDQSGAMALVNLLTSFLTAQNNMQMANLSARTNEAVADKYVAMDKLVADINRSNILDQISSSKYVSDNSVRAAQISAGAVYGAAELNSFATRYMSENNLEGTKYAYDMQKEIAKINNDAYLDKQHDAQDFEEYMKIHYPQTWSALAGSVANLGIKSGTFKSIWNDIKGIFGSSAIHSSGKF